jgi:hypothetical protein
MPKYLKFELAIINLNDKLYILNKTIPNIMHEHCYMSTVIEIQCYSSWVKGNNLSKTRYDTLNICFLCQIAGR